MGQAGTDDNEISLDFFRFDFEERTEFFLACSLCVAIHQTYEEQGLTYKGVSEASSCDLITCENILYTEAAIREQILFGSLDIGALF